MDRIHDEVGPTLSAQLSRRKPSDKTRYIGDKVRYGTVNTCSVGEELSSIIKITGSQIVRKKQKQYNDIK